MKKEIRFSFVEFCKAAIERLTELNPEIKGAKVEYIKKYGHDPEGRFDEFYDTPDEVAFTL